MMCSDSCCDKGGKLIATSVFFPCDDKIDGQVKEVRKLIRLSMNGVASEGMASLGYKINYGVSLPRLKQLSVRFEKNKGLAVRLWACGIRETIILATMLMPVEQCDVNIAKGWIADIANLEIAEQCCRNLFAYLPYSASLVEYCYSVDTDISVCVAYLLASKVLSNGVDYRLIIKNRVEEDLCNSRLSMPIAQFLKQVSRQGEDAKLMVLDLLKKCKDKNGWVFEEVKTYIDYMK